jgi:hypothetical protein
MSLFWYVHGRLARRRYLYFEAKVYTESFDSQAEQLDLHKNKATDLLKANEGNVTLAMKAFITPSFGV